MTKKLRIAQDLFDFLYPVGCYFETSNTNWTPQSAGWYGIWQREDDGTVLVSYKSSGAFNKTIETIVGSETHTLTISEMPTHSHYAKGWAAVVDGSGSYITLGGAGVSRTYATDNTGGGNAHSIVQTSKVVYRWHRTA